jgi:hypothetical protein
MIAVPANDNTKLVGLYVGEKCGCSFDDGMYQALAILNDKGEFCAGVVISEFRGHDCQISCATETSVAWRDTVVTAVFDYIFNQLGCVRCTSITKKGNRRTRAFLEGLGFKLEGRVRRGFDGTQDALLYGLLAEECRYISNLQDGHDEVQTGSQEAEPSSEPH